MTITHKKVTATEVPPVLANWGLAYLDHDGDLNVLVLFDEDSKLVRKLVRVVFPCGNNSDLDRPFLYRPLFTVGQDISEHVSRVVDPLTLTY